METSYFVVLSQDNHRIYIDINDIKDMQKTNMPNQYIVSLTNELKCMTILSKEQINQYEENKQKNIKENEEEK